MANQIIDKALAFLGNFVTKTAWAQGSYSRVWYRKVGDVVTITMGQSVGANISANTWVYIDNLPENFRPSRIIYGSISCDNQANTAGAVRIQPYGDVEILTKEALQSTNSYVAFNISYVVGGVKLIVVPLVLMWHRWPHEQSDYRQKHSIFGSSVQSGYGNIPVNRFKWVRRCDGHIRERNVCSADSMRHPKWCRTIGLSFGLCNDLKKQNRFYATLLELWHKCGISNYPMDSDHAYSVALPERGCA